MTTPSPESTPFGPGFHLWCSLWQAQVEQSLKAWTWWAQLVPHQTSAEMSAEAESLKPHSETAAPRESAAPGIETKRARKH